MAPSRHQSDTSESCASQPSTPPSQDLETGDAQYIQSSSAKPCVARPSSKCLYQANGVLAFQVRCMRALQIAKSKCIYTFSKRYANSLLRRFDVSVILENLPAKGVKVGIGLVYHVTERNVKQLRKPAIS